jgi:hypothetical protein
MIISDTLIYGLSITFSVVALAAAYLLLPFSKEEENNNNK